MLTKSELSDVVAELLRIAETDLPADVETALKAAAAKEKGRIAKTQLESILANIKCAREGRVPLCQDTGLPVFYVKVGDPAGFPSSLIADAIKEGVRKATRQVPLRPNAVHPLTRKNSGDNTGTGIPVIDYEMIEGADHLEISVLPKGAGSENMSALRMMNPSEGIGGIKKFVLETVAAAGGNPCPPTIIGMGIGGTADYAVKLSKKALLRKIGSASSDKAIAALERGLLSDINKLGVGPMGLGGDTTALAVNIEYAYCHTASLPVAINMQCWANRRATVRISAKGKADYL